MDDLEAKTEDSIEDMTTKLEQSVVTLLHERKAEWKDDQETRSTSLTIDDRTYSLEEKDISTQMQVDRYVHMKVEKNNNTVEISFEGEGRFVMKINGNNFVSTLSQGVSPTSEDLKIAKLKIAEYLEELNAQKNNEGDKIGTDTVKDGLRKILEQV